MAKPWIHSLSSVRKFGGAPEDYIGIHNFLDSSKGVNDGDTCEFSANTGYDEEIYINGVRDGYGDDDEDEDIECPSCQTYIDDEKIKFCPSCGTAIPSRPEPVLSNDDAQKAREAIVDMMKNFDDDILLDLYDDHAKVTVFRSGKATVDEYEHD